MNTLPLIDNCFVIPTPIGMPLHINFTALAVMKVHGHITPVSMPSMRDLWYSRSLLDDIKVAVDIKPRFNCYYFFLKLIDSRQILLFCNAFLRMIKFSLTLLSSFAVKMLCEMGVHMNILKATTTVKGHIIGHAPIKSEVSMNLNEKKFKFNWEVPQEVSN